MSSGTLINQIDQISSNLNDCYGPMAVNCLLKLTVSFADSVEIDAAASSLFTHYLQLLDFMDYH